MDGASLSVLLRDMGIQTALVSVVLGALGKWFLSAQLNSHKLDLDRELAIHQSRLDAALSSHKSELDATNARNIEQTRASLQIAAHKMQARNLRLVEKQAEVVTRTYALLVAAEEACRRMMAQVRLGHEPPPHELAPKTSKATNRFLRYHNRHVIFLDAHTRVPLDEISESFRDAWMRYTVFGIQPKDDGLDHQRFRRQEEAWAIISEKLPEARAKLESAFRRLLGVDSAE